MSQLSRQLAIIVTASKTRFSRVVNTTFGTEYQR